MCPMIGADEDICRQRIPKSTTGWKGISVDSKTAIDNIAAYQPPNDTVISPGTSGYAELNPNKTNTFWPLCPQ